MGSSNFWGQTIRDLRVEKKISQRQLAEDTKVNRATLRKIEEGLTPGDIDSISRLLEYFGYELDAVTRESMAEKKRIDEELLTDPVKRSELAADRLLTMRLL